MIWYIRWQKCFYGRQNLYIIFILSVLFLMLSDKPLLYVSSAFLSALDIIIEWTSVFNKHTHSLTHPKAKAKHVQTILWKAVASLKKRGGGGWIASLRVLRFTTCVLNVKTAQVLATIELYILFTACISYTIHVNAISPLLYIIER